MNNVTESIFHSFFEITGTTFIVILVLNAFLGNFYKKEKMNGTTTGALLGAIPGCSGAISSSIMYSKSKITFGVLVASLIATMGDGAFLLISTRPKEFLIITAITFTLAVIVGTIIKKLDIKITKDKTKVKVIVKKEKYGQNHLFNIFNKYAWRIFLILIPLISIMSIGHTTGLIDHHYVHTMWFEIISFITLTLMAINAIVINALSTCKSSCDVITCKEVHGKYYVLKKTFDQTSSIITMLLIFLVPMHMISHSLNLEALLSVQQNIIWLIILVSLISLIPGSAPQILVVSLFLESKIPLVLLLASSIATSGDATFILFKSRKKAFLIASLINLVLAISISIAFLYINK